MLVDPPIIRHASRVVGVRRVAGGILNFRGRKLVSVALLAASSVLTFAACSHISESDVYGRYVAHYDAGSETVTLARYHSYVL